MRKKKFVLLCYIDFELKFQMIPLRLKQMNLKKYLRFEC